MRYLLLLSFVSLICINGYFFADPTAGEARENIRIVNNWIKENQKITEFTKRYKELGKKTKPFNVYRVSPIAVNPAALKNCEEVQNILKSGKTEIQSIDIDGNVLLVIKKNGDYAPYYLFLASSTGYKKAINEAVCGFSVYNLGKGTPLFLDLTGCGVSGFAVNLYTVEGGFLKNVLSIGGWQPTEQYVDIDNDGVSEIVNSYRVSNVDLIEEKLTNFNFPLILVQEDFYKFQDGKFENVGITYRANNSDLNEEVEKKIEVKYINAKEIDIAVEKTDEKLITEKNYTASDKKIIKTKYYDNGKMKYMSVYTPDSDIWKITDFETNGKVKKTTIIESGKIK